MLEHSAVVLFFYVKAFTPVCMAEVCSFRDRNNAFQDLNATILGVSPDGAAITRQFAAFHRLPFEILLDRGDAVRNLYGVPSLSGLLPGRSTFVIGQNREIVHATNAGLDSARHIAESLESLRRAPQA